MTSPHPFGLQHAIAALPPDDPWQETVVQQAAVLARLLTPVAQSADAVKAAAVRQQLDEAAKVSQRIERDLALLRDMGTPLFPMPPAAAARLAAMEHAVDVLHANLTAARQWLQVRRADG